MKHTDVIMGPLVAPLRHCRQHHNADPAWVGRANAEATVQCGFPAEPRRTDLACFEIALYMDPANGRGRVELGSWVYWLHGSQAEARALHLMRALVNHLDGTVLETLGFKWHAPHQLAAPRTEYFDRNPERWAAYCDLVGVQP